MTHLDRKIPGITERLRGVFTPNVIVIYKNTCTIAMLGSDFARRENNRFDPRCDTAMVAPHVAAFEAVPTSEHQAIPYPFIRCDLFGNLRLVSGYYNRQLPATMYF
jgi:hypothetical protein